MPCIPERVLPTTRRCESRCTEQRLDYFHLNITLGILHPFSPQIDICPHLAVTSTHSTTPTTSIHQQPAQPSTNMAVAANRKVTDTSPPSVPKKTTKIQKTYRANTTAKRAATPSTKPTKPTATATTDMQPQLDRIAASPTLTPYQKRVLTLLCQVPRGHVTTYALMAAHLGSSPRAVGNAMRRNPFAPEVPCHRCVATGGGLGGFKGQWPKDGEGITLDEKRMLLRKEGVRWDDAGRVLGTPFGGFV